MRYVVIDGKSINHVDLTGCEMLGQGLLSKHIVHPQHLLWQLAGWPLGTMAAETGLHRCFGYAQASGSPTGATYRCLSMPRRLDPQPGLHTGAWSPNLGYTGVFGSLAGATHGCLESKPGLHMVTWVFGVPNGRLCKLLAGAFHFFSAKD